MCQFLSVKNQKTERMILVKLNVCSIFCMVTHLPFCLLVEQINDIWEAKTLHCFIRFVYNFLFLFFILMCNVFLNGCHGTIWKMYAFWSGKKHGDNLAKNHESHCCSFGLTWVWDKGNASRKVRYVAKTLWLFEWFFKLRFKLFIIFFFFQYGWNSSFLCFTIFHIDLSFTKCCDLWIKPT